MLSMFICTVCMCVSFYHNKKFTIIRIKIDTIQCNINFKAKNVKGNTPNYSGRDSIKSQADVVSIMVSLEVPLLQK